MEGIVEVFDLKNHPKASRLYAWAYETDNPKKPRQCNRAAHGACRFALAAVKAAIVEELRNRPPEEA